jgi:hypothetical protein
MFSSIKRLQRQSGIHGPIASWRCIYYSTFLFYRYCQHNVIKEMVIKCLRFLSLRSPQSSKVGFHNCAAAETKKLHDFDIKRNT